MNYKKLWNNLKDELIMRAETEHQPGVDAEHYLIYASKLLMKMNKAEVAEVKKECEAEKKLDLVFAESLFEKGVMNNGE